MNAITSLSGMFTENRQAISDPQNEESLIAAFGYWQGWPELLGAIRAAAEQDADAAYTLRRELAFTHEEAENRLMIEAVKLGIDPSGFCEAGRYCRELICSDCCTIGLHATLTTWPDFLGQRRYELPPVVQQAIADGEALLRTMNAKLMVAGSSPLGKPKGKPGPKPGKLAKRNARIYHRSKQGDRPVDIARDERLSPQRICEIIDEMKESDK